ncbi:MAG: hypothetical protein ABR497_06065, partial [Kiritimatiellia bacterium]
TQMSVAHHRPVANTSFAEIVPWFSFRSSGRKTLLSNNMKKIVRNHILRYIAVSLFARMHKSLDCERPLV